MPLKRIIVVLIVSLAVLYLGLGAYTDFQLGRLRALPAPATPSAVIADGIPFRDLSDYQMYKYELARSRWFPWADYFTEQIDIFLLSTIAGYFGGLLRDLRDKLRINSDRRFIRAYEGLVLAVFIYALSFLYPKVFMENEAKLRLSSLIAMCFFCGAFGEETWRLINKKIKGMLKKL